MAETYTRRLAARLFKLHIICDQPACRRARECADPSAPCIIRYKRHYQEFLPQLRAALNERMRKVAAERRDRPRD